MRRAMMIVAMAAVIGMAGAAQAAPIVQDESGGNFSGSGYASYYPGAHYVEPPGGDNHYKYGYADGFWTPNLTGAYVVETSWGANPGHDPHAAYYFDSDGAGGAAEVLVASGVDQRELADQVTTPAVGTWSGGFDLGTFNLNSSSQFRFAYNGSAITTGAWQFTDTVIPPPEIDTVIYGPLTYTDGDVGSQGGPYAYNLTPRTPSFTGDNLDLSGPRAHSLTYDMGFSTTLSSYSVTTTHVSSEWWYERRGLMAYAVDGVGAMGFYLRKNDPNIKYGSISESGTEAAISIIDAINGANQFSGDGTSTLDSDATYDITMDITDTGTDATSMFAYTFTQGSNIWKQQVSFADMITASTDGTAAALIASARNLAETTTYAFYTFEGPGHSTIWDDTFVTAAAPPIPEPAGLGLIGLALLAVRKRRS